MLMFRLAIKEIHTACFSPDGGKIIVRNKNGDLVTWIFPEAPTKPKIKYKIFGTATPNKDSELSEVPIPPKLIRRNAEHPQHQLRSISPPLLSHAAQPLPKLCRTDTLQEGHAGQSLGEPIASQFKAIGYIEQQIEEKETVRPIIVYFLQPNQLSINILDQKKIFHVEGPSSHTWIDADSKVLLTPDGKKLIIVNALTFVIIDIQENKINYIIPNVFLSDGHHFSPHGACISHDGTLLYIPDTNYKIIHIINISLPNFQNPPLPADYDSPCQQLCISVNGKYLAIYMLTNVLLLYTMETKTLTQRIKLLCSLMTDISFSCCENYMIMALDGTKITFIHSTSKQALIKKYGEDIIIFARTRLIDVRLAPTLANQELVVINDEGYIFIDREWHQGLPQ